MLESDYIPELSSGFHSRHVPTSSTAHTLAAHQQSLYSHPQKHHHRPSAPLVNQIIVAVAVALILAVTVLGSFTFSLHRKVKSQASELREVRTEIQALQSAIETFGSTQTAQSDKVDNVRRSLASAEQTLKTSLDAKLSSMHSTLAAYQEQLAKMKSALDATSIFDDKINALESQTEMFRRMFGLSGASPSPDGNPNQPQQQQFHPGGYPTHGDNYDQGTSHHSAPQQPYVMHPPLDRAADLPDPTKALPDKERNEARAGDIKAEFLASWRAYRKYAWGHDELCPNSRSHKDWGGPKSHGTALTAVDALSTMYLMGLHDEFDEAVKLITEYVDYDQDISVSVFETTIRVVGGLLSAYELSGEVKSELLETAVYVMNKLLHAFNTTTGIPHQAVNYKTHEHWNPDWSNGASVLSEFGSIQLELRTLSFHTDDPIYDMKATHLMNILESRCQDMMCPTMFDVASGEVRSDQITLGALGDSYYEYLLKQYILTDGAESKYRAMAEKALEAIRVRLLRYSTPSHQAYFGELTDGAFDYKMDHLACFAGGMYALAAMRLGDPSKTQTYRKIAADITETCFTMYDTQATGIAPEIVEFAGGQDFHPGEAYYLLRPETVESIFYMWRLTKDEKYRTYQWKIFQHIKKYCKAEATGAYSGITMVSIVPPEQDDLMQSFWLAETLKYMYLTFVEDGRLDLNVWVLNTEAHPLKIRRRDPVDVWRKWEDEHDGQLPWYPPTVSGVASTETERMLRDRMANGGVIQRVAPVDPQGTDMKAQDENTMDNDKMPYNPSENVYLHKPTRHDTKWRKAKRAAAGGGSKSIKYDSGSQGEATPNTG